MGRLQQDVQWRQAEQALAAGQLDQARSLCEGILDRQKNNARAMAMLGQIAFTQNRFEDAASHMLQASALRPKALAPYLVLAEIRTFQGRFDDAVALCDKVLRLDPDSAQAIGGKADAYEKSGQRDKARALLRPLIEQGRETTQQAIVQARLDAHDRNFDAIIDLTTRHIERPEAGGRTPANLFFILGRALENTKRFDEAFATYERANRAVSVQFDLESWVRSVDDIINTYSPQRFASVPRAGRSAPTPIFVVGMPRSGSTLVETILDSHPDVAAAGELMAIPEIVNSISLDIGSNLPYPACVEDFDQADVETTAANYIGRLRRAGGEANHIVDKYLNNYMHVGLLAILFPDAPIIHCCRHPLDTCFSCFQALAPTAHPYATELGTLGTAYINYERLMTHWRDVLKIPMLEVPYETMVNDQDGMTRRLLDFCNLDFDERCLRFYESGRVVLTASYDQVNKPVYSSSVGRYRNFEKHLGPLKEALAEGGWTEEAFERAATAG
ncbi:MAG: tetratricopeptide repeat-containing sulfotransferase family protein [Planctomycetota bacterium]|jgi:tetratricopeptide (TPR) repeat protein